ncbi:hypothetical protein BASA81_001784 [Batrachochytrium salamandrivorans]|nr:hypothetical protein BASA81_001784 [Batrachochytrium salamandrivorans]
MDISGTWNGLTKRNMSTNVSSSISVEWPKASTTELVLVFAFSLLCWHLLVSLALPRIQLRASQMEFWEAIKLRSGTLAGNGQDDITLMSILAIHHLTSGSLCVLGDYLHLPFVFRLGAMLELGFEVSDTVALFRGEWPHQPDKEPLLMRIALFAHHLPGMTLIVPLFYTGYYSNAHIRAVGSWLLFAGGISSLGAFLVYTRNFANKREMQQAAMIQAISGLFFVYARFLVFPVEMYTFAEELASGNLFTGANTVRIMGVFMTIFNVIVLKTNLIKTIKYLIKAFVSDGVEVNDLSKQD